MVKLDRRSDSTNNYSRTQAANIIIIFLPRLSMESSFSFYLFFFSKHPLRDVAVQMSAKSMPVANSTCCCDCTKRICDVFLPSLSWLSSASFPHYNSMHYCLLKPIVLSDVATILYIIKTSCSLVWLTPRILQYDGLVNTGYVIAVSEQCDHIVLSSYFKA